MSQSNLPATLMGVQRLIERIQTAERSQQKDIRLSMQEAKALVNELAIFSGQLGKAIQDINISLKNISDNTQNIEVKFDGGGFN